MSYISLETLSEMLMSILLQHYETQVQNGTIRDDPIQRDVLTLFQRLITELSQQPTQKTGLLARFKRSSSSQSAVKSIYVWGGVGRGKTFLMDILFKHSPVPAKRVHFHEFMQDVQSQLHELRQTNIDDPVVPIADKIAKEARLLCFDEMQITDIADAMIVGRLFEQLFEQGVVVVATSNRAPDELYKNGLNRQLFLPFIALMKEKSEIYHLDAKTDYRQGRLNGARVYFSPADHVARAACDEIWQSFLGENGQASPLTLTVKGRKIILPLAFNGVVRTNFWDMCAQMYGPADYLAIASAVRVLIIEDVPRLSRHNFSEAKRFVTLIDALYEARVRLVVSAADEPEKLYVEGEGAFEFERSASRLREMQSESWAVS